MKYEARNFSDLFATQMGAALWEYLQRPAVILALEVATKLHRPAVEAVGDDLIMEFGDSVRERRIKQLIGHMVRQVLEARGYELDAQRVPVRFDGLCSSGSRYRAAGNAGARPLKLEEAEPEPDRQPARPRDEARVAGEERGEGGDWATWGGLETGAA